MWSAVARPLPAGTTPLWLEGVARAMRLSQSGVAGRVLALCRRTPYRPLFPRHPQFWTQCVQNCRHA